MERFFKCFIASSLAGGLALPIVWDLESNRLAVDHVVRRIGKLDQNAMRPGIQSLDNQGLAACVYPMPAGAIERDMDVADPRDHAKGGRTENWNDTEVIRAILNHSEATL